MDVNIGDTVTLAHNPAEKALPGYESPAQMVFCDFYPGPGTETAELREAMERFGALGLRAPSVAPEASG